MDRNYVSPKQQQHQDGREQQDQQVAAFLASSTPLRPSRTSTVWNEALGRYVEVR